jgi:hypothetical protein
MRRRTLIGAAIAAAVGLTALPAHAQTTEINFGIISTEASSNLKKIWEPFLEAMAKGTGYKVNGFYASDYAGVIEAMSFGRVGTAEELAQARTILTGLQWAPFKPSSNAQLLAIRILEANREAMKIAADSKLADTEKKAKVDALQAEIKQWQSESEKAATSPFAKRVEAFLAADKADNKAELKKMIAEFAAAVSATPTH